jgi:hypothetical protein
VVAEGGAIDLHDLGSVFLEQKRLKGDELICTLPICCENTGEWIALDDAFDNELN